MHDRTPHWSERARLANSSTPPPASVLRKPPPPRSKRKYALGGIGILVVAVIAVVVVVLVPWGGSTTSTPRSSVTTFSAQVKGATATTAPTPPPTSFASVDPGMSLYEEPSSGYSFQYPASWAEFSPEGLLGTDVPLPGSIGLGDPNAGRFGTTPANCLAFAAHLATEEELEAAEGQADQSLVAELEEASAHWESTALPDLALEVVEPAAGFQINGLEAAEKTYRLLAQGHPLRMRIVFAESDTSGCVFFMYAEEKYVEYYWPLFDRIVGTLRLGDTI